jgi:MFS family permease
MGDVVPEKIRGKYFAKRNMIAGVVSLSIAFLAALWLDYLGKSDLVIYGFMFLFAISAFGRLMSAFLFTKHEPPELKLEKGYYFSFSQFLKKAPFNNFGRFAIFIALLNFCISIAGPFYAVYMLNDLGFSYFWFILVNLSTSLFVIVFIPIWGRFSDSYGNKEVMRIASFMIPFVPILWTFSTSPVYLILVPQFISGFAWGGFNLAASNFIHDAVTSQRKGIVVAYYSMLNGTGVFLGAGLGGIIAHFVNFSFINTFFLLFILTSISTSILFLIMLPKIKEVRKETKPIRKNPFSYVKEIKYNSGIPKVRVSPLSSLKLITKEKI